MIDASKWNLDELVAKVMADLRGGAVGASASDIGATLTRDFRAVRSNAQQQTESNAIPVEASAPATFELSEKIVVLDVVRKALASTTLKRWRVSADAIVTPSAKDELKKNGIELDFGSASKSNAERTVRTSRTTISASNVPESFASAGNYFAVSKASSASRPRVLIANHLPNGKAFPQFVLEHIARNADYTEAAFSCLKETTKRVAEELASDPNLRVIIATEDSAIASIWANRLSGVRAVVADSRERAVRDFVAANANVAIVDPRDVGAYQFRQIVDAFLRASVK